MNTRQEFEEVYKESHYSLWWNSSNDLFLTDEDECYYDRDVQKSWINWQAERNQKCNQNKKSHSTKFSLKLCGISPSSMLCFVQLTYQLNTFKKI